MTWTTPEPIAYFITWTTYGSWLPGDERGWVEKPGRFRDPDPAREDFARHLMTEPECSLNGDQRRIVEQTVTDHCTIRGWHLHIVNCRTKHVHVVVSAPVEPDHVLQELKTWCTRKLREHERTTLGPGQSRRENWWTENGSKRKLFDDDGLEAAVVYVRDCQ